MKDYTVMNHRDSKQEKSVNSRFETVRDSIYTDILRNKSNVNIPLNKQLNRFMKSIKK